MKTIFLIASFLFSLVVYSQSHGSVSGTITDLEMNGEPLLFANIELKDTEWGAQTNLNGNFEMSGITPGKYILAIGFPGYETLEIPIEVSENELVRIQEELFVKSVDVGSLLDSDLDTEAKIAVLVPTRAK
ncbi:carboxypeptidase-like regulatory domain-containing protein [Pricia sp.]|uniref:carboxypeptidase-like regulatory domain-containing protein n=1 Tax=Pricia sp. TaxID=2268138 RepID=UPI0035945616